MKKILVTILFLVLGICSLCIIDYLGYLFSLVHAGQNVYLWALQILLCGSAILLNMVIPMVFLFLILYYGEIDIS